MNHLDIINKATVAIIQYLAEKKDQHAGRVVHNVEYKEMVSQAVITAVLYVNGLQVARGQHSISAGHAEDEETVDTLLNRVREQIVRSIVSDGIIGLYEKAEAFVSPIN